MQRYRSGAIASAIRALLACLLVLGIVADVGAQVRVRGYTKKNGTYVAPHYRSSPNRTKSDNYSTRGNYNPYTGKRGAVDPYANSYPTSFAAPAYRPPAPIAIPALPTPTVSPGPPTTSLSWSRYQPAPQAAPPSPPVTVSYAPAAPAAPAPPAPPAITSVFRCEDAQGTLHYLSYPRAGCVEIEVQIQQQVAVQPRPLLVYGGYRCTSDCSGHDAGHDWAEENGIDDPDDCDGNSQSFIEGCQAYAEAEMGEDAE